MDQDPDNVLETLKRQPASGNPGDVVNALASPDTTAAQVAAPAQQSDSNPADPLHSRTHASRPATVPYYQLYQYADRVDMLLMVAGSIGAIVHGASMPVFFLFAGDITNGFGAGDMKGVLKYSLYLVVADSVENDYYCTPHTSMYPFWLHRSFLICLNEVFVLWSKAKTSIKTPISLSRGALPQSERRYTKIRFSQLGPSTHGGDPGGLHKLACVRGRQVSFWMLTGERQAARIRELYLSAVLKQEMAFFDHGAAAGAAPGAAVAATTQSNGSGAEPTAAYNASPSSSSFSASSASSGHIVAAITSDVLLLQDAISEKVGSFLQFFSTFIAGFAIGFSKSWNLSLVILAVVPVIAICGAVYSIVMAGLTSKEQEAYAEAGSIAQQALSQVRTIYSFVAEEKTLARYSAALETTMKLGIKSGLSKGVGVGAIFGTMFCAWALTFWYSSVLVAASKADAGTILTTMFAVLIGGVCLGQSLANLQFFSKGQAAAFILFATISRRPLILSDDPQAEPLGPKVVGALSFSDVRFAYPSRPHAPVLHGLTLSLPACHSMALVGPSGGGKSTLLALLLRFYDPQSGVVALDGRDVRRLRLADVRAHIGMVSQEPALFACSIRENILYGLTGASMEQVEAAARAANAHNFIAEFREGYDTQVGERGVQMSGGQKQRIAIARAIVRNPEILLLDEATSALDAQSESVVQEALNGVMAGRTTVMIAHRLSTIRHADCIAVVIGGRVVEQGSHEQLMARAEVDGQAGEYARLVCMQLAGVTVATATAATAAQEESAAGGGDKEEGIQDEKVAMGITSQYASAPSHSLLSLSSSSLSKKHGVSKATSAGSKVQVASSSGSWLRLFRMTLPEWPYTAAAMVGAAGAGALNPLFGLFLTSVVVAFFNPDTEAMKREVSKWALALTAMGVASLLFYSLQHYSFGVVGEHLTRRVREAMLRAYLRNEVAWYDQPANSSGALAARLSSDASLLKGAVTDRISVLFQNTSLILIAFAIAFILSWRMAVVVIACCPLIVGAALTEQAFLRGFAGDLKAAHQSASTLASEAVVNIRTVAAFSLEKQLLRRFHDELAGPQQRAVVRGQIAGFGYGLSGCLLFLTYALLFWYMTTIIPTYASFESTFKVYIVLVMTSTAVAETLTLAPDFAKGGAAIASFFEIIDREPSILPDDPTADVIPPEAGSIRGDIQLKHVRFAYPTRPHALLFQDLCLHVPAGSALALVGASGSGKSSVVSLIERFYDPQGGKVCVDGRDVRGMNLRSLRVHIGLVSQEPALFSGSIRDNILFGRSGASEAEVIEAARAANAHNFISALPDGYETSVGELGAQLSGGQKQRVAIARAVLKNPTILLLDEATSALDAESERVVQEAVDRLMGGRTSIVVAHRLSTIRHSHRIAVVQDGKVVEEGSHEDLFADVSSAYHALVQLQQAGGIAACAA